MNVVAKNVAFYLDCDDELHRLPLEDVHKFEDRVFDPHPGRKNGRYGATVVLEDDDDDVEDRARAHAKHLIGLHKQKVKLGLVDGAGGE